MHVECVCVRQTESCSGTCIVTLGQIHTNRCCKWHTAVMCLCCSLSLTHTHTRNTVEARLLSRYFCARKSTAHKHTHTRARTYARTHTHKHTQRMYTDTYTHAHTHTHTHTHSYLWKPTQYTTDKGGTGHAQETTAICIKHITCTAGCV